MYENKLARLGVKRLLVLQLALTVLCVVVAALFSGGMAAYSAFLGAMVCVLPSQYFAYRVFQYSGARSAKQIVRSFYRGEAMKLLITMILFALVFKYVEIVPLAFFLSFITVQMLNWLAPALFVARKD